MDSCVCNQLELESVKETLLQCDFAPHLTLEDLSIQPERCLSGSRARSRGRHSRQRLHCGEQSQTASKQGINQGLVDSIPRKTEGKLLKMCIPLFKSFLHIVSSICFIYPLHNSGARFISLFNKCRLQPKKHLASPLGVWVELLMATVTNLRHWLQKQVQPAYKPQNNILFIEFDQKVVGSKRSPPDVAASFNQVFGMVLGVTFSKRAGRLYNYKEGVRYLTSSQISSGASHFLVSISSITLHGSQH